MLDDRAAIALGEREEDKANHVKAGSVRVWETYADVEAGRIDTFLCAEEAPLPWSPKCSSV